MTKGSQLFIGALLVVIIILIIYMMFGGKKPPQERPNLFKPANGNPANGNPSPPTPPIGTPPPVKVSEQTFSIGDQIYAGENLTNVYDSCSFSSAGVVSTYNVGDLIGTFLRKEPLCIVIAVKTYNPLLGLLGLVWGGSDTVYLSLNSPVYKK